MLRFVVEGINQNVFVGIALQGAVAGIAGLVTIITVYHILQTQELTETLHSFRNKMRQTDVDKP
jgi:hypothetical protein